MFVRGLVRRDGDRLLPVDELATIVDVLSRSDAWVQVGLARRESVGGVQYYALGDDVLEAAAEPFGTFAFSFGDTDASISKRVTDLLHDFLTGEPGAAFVKAGRDSTPEQDGLAIGLSESGKIEVARGDVQRAAPTAETLENALDAVRAYVADPSS